MGAVTAAPYADTPDVIEWAVATAPLGGGPSGDAYVVVPCSHGTLVAVIDGLGHGFGAAVAAGVAAATIETHAGEPLTAIMSACHEEMRRTRGAVISLASFDARDDVMTWLGVGNVEGVLLRADAGRNGVREVLVAPGGVVGYQMPTLRPAAYPVFRDDVLMFATDGIHRGYARQPAANRRLQEVADHALLHHSKGTDDALILVARYVGGL